MKKSLFQTFGCKLNSFESEAMEVLCENEGLENIIVINTCSVTAEAVRKAKKTIRRSHREHPSKKIVVTGCAAQIAPKIFNSMAEVDFVIGNEEKLSSTTWNKIRNDVDLKEQASKIFVKDIMNVTKIKPWQIKKLANRSRAYVQIQNGCDHRCTFCIIPYGRGNSRSVLEKEIITQVQILVDNGFKEIVLTGVDLTSWGNDLPESPKLGFLIKNILSKVKELSRLRLSSVDSVEVDSDLIDVIINEERFMPHLHLSLQSGDNLILKRMKRRHSREQAINFCQTIQHKRPEVTFGADIIVGFPTEDDRMFRNSVELVRECNLTWLHIFPFSPREGTPAYKMPSVNGADIKDRALELRNLGHDKIKEHLETLIGRKQAVLIEGNGRGRTQTFAEVIVDPSLPAGEIKNLLTWKHNGTKLVCY
tara:strand:- start:843 stop:2105 length:1263 start_codon:yes stop_codon:yes gene_type:complete